MGTIGELFMTLGFDVDDQKLKAFNDGIKETTQFLEKNAIAAATAVGALNIFVEKQAASAVHMRNLNAEWGINIRSMQEWSIAANLLNPEHSVEEYAEKFKTLKQALTEVSLGGGPREAVQMLTGGVATTGMSPEAILDAIQKNKKHFIDSMGGDVATWSRYANQVAGLSDMARVMDKSAEERKAMAAPFIVDDKTLKNLDSFADASAKMANAWHIFSMDIGGDIGPRLVKVIDNITAALLRLDTFNKDHPGMGSVEAGAGAAAAGWGGWALLKKIGGWFGAGAGGAGSAAEATGGAGLMGSLGILAAMGSIPWVASWAGTQIGTSMRESGVQSPFAAKGLRNNNPGNLMPGGHEAHYPDADSGLYAMAKNLENYQKKGWNTIDAIINHWSPANAAGNTPLSTENYKATVATITGYLRNQPLDLNDPAVLRTIMPAMIQFENGRNPFPQSQIDKAAQRAEVNVTQHIHSTAPAQDVADLVNRHFQNILDNTYTPLNPGPVF